LILLNARIYGKLIHNRAYSTSLHRAPTRMA
jgi:hypothetical protein